MRDKSGIFHFFVNLYHMVQTQFESPIKRLCYDNGGDYINQNISKFLKENGVHELNCLDTPQQNGVTKRKNHHLLEVTRALLSNQMFLDLLGEAILTTIYLINRLHSRVLEAVSLVQLIITCYPSIPITTSLQSRVFGCPIFVHVHSPYWGKLDPRAIKCVFLDYASNKKRYKCYHYQSRKIYVSKDVTFQEIDSFPSSQLQRESIQEAEVLELPPFPLLEDFILMENDKDPTSTSLPKKNNEDKYFGKKYQRRQQEPVLVEQQLQLSEPK